MVHQPIRKEYNSSSIRLRKDDGNKHVNMHHATAGKGEIDMMWQYRVYSFYKKLNPNAKLHKKNGIA